MSKSLWILLLIVTGALALWRGTIGGFAFWDYQNLSASAPSHIQNIEIIPKGSKYALQVTYSYRYQEKVYTKSMLLAKPYHLNRLSAESMAKTLTGMNWQAYFDAKRPHLSTLEPHFPLREVLYGACLIGVFFYFLYMKIHLELLSKAM